MVGREHLPERRGPVLYLGLHRNGAVDGFVYGSALRAPVFMISTQLRRSALGRMFFSGIPVVRDKDAGDRGSNDQALQLCLDHLRAGGELFVLPEGTSSLGPRHLPFRSGAVWLLREYLADPDSPPLTVMPLGIHYERAWAFRSRVELLVGRPLATTFPANTSPRDVYRELRQRMSAALEAVGVNFADSEQQALGEQTAYAATLGTSRSYARTLKALESSTPPKVNELWREFEGSPVAAKVCRHQGVPLVPSRFPVGYGIALLLAGPLVLAGIGLNLPPFIAAWWAGRRFADDRNVVALWRLLVGAPALALWCGVMTAGALATGHLTTLLVYLTVTVAGWMLYYRVKKLAVAVANLRLGPAVRKRLLVLHAAIQNALSDDTA